MYKEHHYKLTALWQGDNESGNSNVHSYNRNHTISIDNKPALHLTTDNAAVGDKNKLNPEDLLLAAIASCHMLSYLYVCSLAGVVVTAYKDHAHGIMVENDAEGGHFTSVTLEPIVTVVDKTMLEKALALHHQAHQICYIANSVNFEIKINAQCIVHADIIN